MFSLTIYVYRSIPSNSIKQLLPNTLLKLDTKYLIELCELDIVNDKILILIESIILK